MSTAGFAPDSANRARAANFKHHTSGAEPMRKGDGRPDWYITKRSIAPTLEAQRLGAAAEAFIRGRKDRALDPENAADWLIQSLVQIADEYLARRAHRDLPSAEAYRTRALRIQKATEALLDEIRTDKDLSWNLSLRVRGRLDLNLWHNPKGTTPSLEKILSRFAEACSDSTEVEAKTAERPRDDIRVLANRLAALWSQLSGKRFPKSLHRTPDPNRASGTLREFKAPSSRFVHEVAQVIDLEIAFEQIESALRKRRVDRADVAPSQ